MISMIHLLRRRENLRGTVNEEQLSKRRDTVARMRASEMEIFFFSWGGCVVERTIFEIF